MLRTTEQRFDNQTIDVKWQKRWTDAGMLSVKDDDPRPKWYELTMYPYPSGDLHIGHWYAMSPSDAHARFQAMKGYNVLHPMGFDAFGLPAENAAIQRGIHPYTWTMDNMANMRRQLRSMGTIYDWDREVVTCIPEYYQWNQWIFLQFYKAGLAYRNFAPANWCPQDNTVLANEQVLPDGTCERCGTTVVRRELNQWFFRITKYADELLDHSKKEWPERIDTMQTNWIGRSEGVEIEFDISEYGLDVDTIRTFTTRIDTIYGVTFVVMAPEHPLVERLTTPDQKAEVEAYIEQTRRQSEIERMSTEKEKTGVYTGAYCINRLNGERVPLLIGDYVLGTYGTGIVMGVPAHDQRDFEFATKYDLPIRVVVSPEDWDGGDLTEAYLEVGKQVNSAQFDGIPSDQGWQKIADYIEENGWGNRTVQYRMRDWLISRQRYWGTPIPVIYCDDCGTVPVPEADLPVVLPQDAEFRPTGESPLASHQGFVNTPCPTCGKAAKRETDTMDTFVDSSWYYLRYPNNHYAEGPFDPVALKKWNPVDQYTGGAEHAVMHLLYSRFFVKALRDLGLLDFDEPFTRLFNQGIILGADHEKMSKSRGNVVAPDEYVESFGADVVRCFLMFLGPWDQGGSWSDSGINGTARWMNRVWDISTRDARTLDNFPANDEAIRELQRLQHKTIRRVGEDLERFKFNTALAGLMEYSNGMNQAWESKGVRSKQWVSAVESLLTLLAPMAPHITDELWERMGHTESIHKQPWPSWDEELAADDVITLVVQVNGRVRDKIEVSASISEEDATETALASPRLTPYLDGKQVRKVIYVPGKLVNVVVG
ncbi:MAG: leucine--tRNA ligase [SAR202 cluster bacterium Casp-Chloro-G4]|nr:leucine--tRNA ligase [Chloroflexota bacterium]MDA1226392.1 leucine--tRNA ligase [Chloroflexota bacterium]PKB61226.1 MAG: leucine--tRNA ligase [SAR202 cluster bacterium Casp-Chloro-G4]